MARRPTSFNDVFTVAFGHFTHDVYSSFLAPLLPILQDQLGIGYALTGNLAVFTQLPSLLNPFIGYLADRASLRYFVIFAPAVTATLMSSLGLTSNYLSLAFLLLAVGVSVAAFHAPAGAMIGELAGNRIGAGMSIFMAAGELARTIGPIIAIAGVGWFGMAGLWRLAFVGWAISGILFWRLHNIEAKPRAPESGAWARLRPRMMRVFPFLAWLVLGRVAMQSALTTYLPIFMRDQRGVSLTMAAASLTILEAAGFVGALLSGSLSDHLGRHHMLLGLMAVAPLLMIGFLFAPGWMLIPLLILLGMTSISTQPVILALVQDLFPDNRAVANGSYMALSFALRAVGIWAIGLTADAYGLVPAFLLSALVGLLASPSVLFIPKTA
ncbi:MAG: MFS transporter [Clostridia bacterium]|nr:MAG: MFS transporter [Clostridia bacterium]